MRFAFLVCTVLPLVPAPGQAQEQCSLIVRALTPDGLRPEAPISVTEQNGRIQELEQDDGDVRFCDLGILPVTVTVGNSATCNQVVVRDVPIAWDRSYLLRVTYDPEACRERLPPPEPTCEILFHVRSPTGVAVPGAVVRLVSPIEKSYVSDQFGRVEMVLKANSQVRGSAGGGGSKRTDFACKCSRLEPEREVVIRLEVR
jgi:hypothetical protein